jgi:parallel beta-helix repeat protein/predicted outer membrane repeat protein
MSWLRAAKGCFGLNCGGKGKLQGPFLALLVLWVLVSAAAGAKTIYVDADAAGGGGGTSWSDAYEYLQDALADADASAKPVEIRVAQGTYKPDQGAGVEDANRTETFQLINGVALKGGYAGAGDVNPNARDVDLYETILSGDLDGDDVQVPNPSDLLTEPTRAENSYHVVTGSGTDANAVLDGFTITAGNANGTVFPHRSGAGMCAGSPMVLSCTFNNNSAGTGGGMHTWEDVGSVISNCTFRRNYSTHGGGISGEELTLVVVANCTFSDNSAGVGGGVRVSHSDVVLINCTFTGNSVSGAGGGMCTYGDSNWTLINCTFAGNSATYDGGGIAFMTFVDTVQTLTNCVFSGNSSGDGGGAFWTSHGYPTFTNCTFSGNSAGDNGGVYACVYEGDAIFNNCIFWGNTASGEGPQIALETGACHTSVNYSDVQGGESDIYDPYNGLVWGDANNINVDPCFVDADGADDTAGTEDDNLRLLADSNCIDAGDNTAVPADTTDLDGDANTTEPVPYDLDGNPRFIDDLCTADTGNGTAPVVDMGAYEFLRSDIDSDGGVNFKDFARFALYWLDVACGGCSGADLTCDGDVNAPDLKELADNWLW